MRNNFLSTESRTDNCPTTILANGHLTFISGSSLSQSLDDREILTLPYVIFFHNYATSDNCVITRQKFSFTNIARREIGELLLSFSEREDYRVGGPPV